MLALAASDLATGNGNISPSDRSQLTSVALGHRVKAISTLNNAIAYGIEDFRRGNAMLATCFALIFQSTLIEDGFIEYMTFIRGTIAVGIQMGMSKMKFLFMNLFGDQGGGGSNGLGPALAATPLIEPAVAASSCRSFERFEHLCQTKVEKEIHTLLYNTACSLKISSQEGKYLPLLESHGK